MPRSLMFPTCSRCIIAISYFYHNNNIMSIIKQFTSFSVVLSALTRHCGHIDNFSHFFKPLFFLVIKLYQNFQTKSITYLDVIRLNNLLKRELNVPSLPEKLIFLYTITSSQLIHQLVKFYSFIATGTFRTI